MPDSITARIGQGDDASPPVTIEYDLGNNLQDAVKKFGEEVVFSHWKSSATIAVQSRMRAAMKEDVEAGRKPSADKVAKALADYKIGVKKPGVSKVEKAKKYIGEMSDEEKKALLAELQGKG